MQIAFVPENDSEEFVKACKDYQDIWSEFNEKIVQSFENITGLKFNDKPIKAVVYEGISQSHPLKLRASYTLETKKATLVHELGHILLVDNKIIPSRMSSHQLLYLFLYEVWVNLFGKQFADEQVALEKNRTEKYKTAWEWALSKTESDRKKLFSEEVPDIVY